MKESAAQREQHRIEELIAALEALPDPQARDCAKELVQSVLELHAAGLARLLAILNDAAEAGRTTVETLARDESVRALLLLHGLHPQDLAARVRQAVDKIRPEFGAHGIRVELLRASEESVRVKLSGNWRGKALSAATHTHEIEAAIFELAPEVAAVEIEGLPDANVHPIKFLPVSTSQRDRVKANPEAAL